MMSCRCFIEQLDDLMAGTLEEGEQAEADGHLRACPPCVVLMQTYALTIQLTRQLSCQPPAAGGQDRMAPG
jgi:hypothetical protein